MRVAAACQLVLPVEQLTSPADRWGQLPERTRAEVLVLLARLIARGVLVEDAATGRVGSDVGASGG